MRLCVGSFVISQHKASFGVLKLIRSPPEKNFPIQRPTNEKLFHIVVDLVLDPLQTCDSV